jgi:hypothetical protein
MERPNLKPSTSGLSGTGGAIPVRNEKGKLVKLILKDSVEPLKLHNR